MGTEYIKVQKIGENGRKKIANIKVKNYNEYSLYRCKYSKNNCENTKCPGRGYTRWVFDDVKDGKIIVHCPIESSNILVCDIDCNEEDILWEDAMTINILIGICCAFVLIVFISIGVFLHSIFSMDTDYSGKTEKCVVCGNEYNYSSKNARKIRYSGKCVSCYEYSKAINELPR